MCIFNKTFFKYRIFNQRIFYKTFLKNQYTLSYFFYCERLISINGYLYNLHGNRKRRERIVKSVNAEYKKRDLCLLLEKRMENCQAYTSSVSVGRVYLLHASNFIFALSPK